MARCLVIGGNGLIGSSLCRRLAADGHEVTAFDRFSRGSQFDDALGIRIIAGDFLDRDDLEGALFGAENVFHLVSTTNPMTGQSDPSYDLQTNVTQTVELLDLAVEAGVGAFYFASTGGAIYGPRQAEQFDEGMPTEPVLPYAIGKRAIESYLVHFGARSSLIPVALRISNPYGAGQNPAKRQGLIPIVLNRVLHGESVDQFGDGGMVRDYIHVDDLTEMIARMVGVRPQHAVYNMGSGVGHSVAEVLSTIREVTGRELNIRRVETPAGFLDRAVLDVSRFRDEFGPVAVRSLADGIRDVWADIG